MTDIDTAAIRAEIATRNHVCVNGTTAHELCDALDDARTERDYWERSCTVQRDRAEAAEARIAELEAAAHWGLAALSRVSSEIDHARAAKAIELCRDMLPYVPDYFREKWGYDAELAELTGDQ